MPRPFPIKIFVKKTSGGHFVLVETCVNRHQKNIECILGFEPTDDEWQSVSASSTVFALPFFFYCVENLQLLYNTKGLPVIQEEAHHSSYNWAPVKTPASGHARPRDAATLVILRRINAPHQRSLLPPKRDFFGQGGAACRSVMRHFYKQYNTITTNVS